MYLLLNHGEVFTSLTCYHYVHSVLLNTVVVGCRYLCQGGYVFIGVCVCEQDCVITTRLI